MQRHMRYLGKMGKNGSRLAVVIVFGCCLSGMAAEPAGIGFGAIEQLRQALAAPVNPKVPQDLDFRKAELEKRIKQLNKAQLGAALALEEWKDLDQEPEVRAIDAEVRKRLVAAFKDWITRDILAPGSAASATLRLAALAMIGEMGIKVRGQTPETPLTRELASSVIPLLQDAHPLIRQQAARSLGKISPDPEAATTALGQLLRRPIVADRRAAAEGLYQLLNTVLPQMKARSHVGAPLTVPEVVRLASQVTEAIAPALQDHEADIRHSALETIHLAGFLFGELVRDLPTETFPPPGRALTAEDQARIKDYQERVAAEIKEFQPLAQALDRQAGTVARLLRDPRTDLRLLATNALGQIAFAQDQLLRRAASVPRLEPSPREEGDDAAARDASDEQSIVALAQAKVKSEAGMVTQALPQLLQGLRDPDARVRLAVLEVLIVLGERADQATPAVVRALEDGNQFVRWAGVRFFNRVGPKLPADRLATVVDGLIPRLFDTDLDVQLATAAALGNLGRHAVAAAPALSSQVEQGDARIYRYLHPQPPAYGMTHRPEKFGDAEMRMANVRALQGMTEGVRAQPAMLEAVVQALSRALQNRDARVQIAAAEALAQLGPAARAAIPALEAALQGTEADPTKRELVRQAISHALLAAASDH